MEQKDSKEVKEIVLEGSTKLTGAINLLQEKACAATAMTIAEIKERTIIIKDGIVTIK